MTAKPLETINADQTATRSVAQEAASVHSLWRTGLAYGLLVPAAFVAALLVGFAASSRGNGLLGASALGTYLLLVWWGGRARRPPTVVARIRRAVAATRAHAAWRVWAPGIGASLGLLVGTAAPPIEPQAVADKVPTPAAQTAPPALATSAPLPSTVPVMNRGSVPTAPSSSGGSVAAPVSPLEPTKEATPFDALWAQALDPEQHPSIASVFSPKMAKADYCKAFDCGDEFSRDTGWKAARALAPGLMTSLWRIRVPMGSYGLHGYRGLSIGEYRASDKSLPVEMNWPWRLETITVAPRKPLVGPHALTSKPGWISFAAPLARVPFSSDDDARFWKAGAGPFLTYEVVFKIASTVFHSQKIEVAGSSIEFGARGLLIIEIVGERLTVASKVLLETPVPPTRR